MNEKNQNTDESYTIPEGITQLISSIDIDSCMKRLSGDFEFFMSLLDDFNDHYSSSGEKMTRALNRNDFQTARELAHTVKGVAGNLSAYKLSEASAKLEESLNNDKCYDHEPLIKDFIYELNQIITSIMLIKEQLQVPDNETHAPDTSSKNC